MKTAEEIWDEVRYTPTRRDCSQKRVIIYAIETALREAKEYWLEAAAVAVRKDCKGCDDGVAGVEPDGTPYECEYCGRPMTAIRALIPKDLT